MSTPTRRLGRSGIQVSALGVGCWAMGGNDWGGGADDAESVRAIQAALDLGITLFDTADVYGLGRSERVLGQALRGHRDQVVVATKFGNAFDEAAQRWTGLEASPDHIRRACDASLRRLDTDYLDLYQFHWNDYGPQGAEEVREVLEELVAAGKIRWYGWSTDFPDRASSFAEGPHCTAIQCQLNVLDDAPEIRDVCDKHDLATINRGPLAMGLLTGKYDLGGEPLPEDDIRRRTPDWMKYFRDGRPDPQWLERVHAVIEILRSGGRTPTQGALCWLLARSDRNLPIPGFRTQAQLAENCRALEFGPLTPEQLAEIDAHLARAEDGESPR